MIKNQFVKRGDWLKKDIEDTCRFYQNFLFLVRKHEDDTLPPSEDVDEFWHAHILDTKKYHEDCQVIFGHYLHHTSFFDIYRNSSVDDLDHAFAKTQSLHIKEFGEPIVATHASRSKILNVLLSIASGFRRQR